MSAIGPNTLPEGSKDFLTVSTVSATIGSADILASAVFNTGVIRRVYCNAGGTLFVQRVGDTAYPAAGYTVSAGQYIDGQITKVGGTTTGSSAISIVMEG
jgi:hypothetical protein